MRWFLPVCCGLALAGGTVVGLRLRPASVAPRHRETAHPANRTPLKLPLEAPSILVEKAERRLTLYSGRRVVRVYRVALGLNPIGEKEREGDKRTPEGRFYITARNTRSQFYRSLSLSYPNSDEAKRGQESGLITRNQRDKIVTANQRRQTPPQDTPLGGKVLIHGGGSERDWTYGCVALANPDMLEVFRAVPVGTPVTIKP